MSEPSNNLPQSKQEYLRTLLKYSGNVGAALLLYHCEVPLEEAKGYIKTLESKCRFTHKNPKPTFSKP